MKISVFAFLGLLLMSTCSSQQQAPVYPLGPKNTPIVGCFQDYGRNLSDETDKRILELCSTALRQAKINLAIVTVPSLGTLSIEAYALAIGNEWAGKDDYPGNGVIVLLSFTDRKIRIDLDESTAKRMSDAKAKAIIQTVFIPRFREGQNDLGTMEGVQAILDWFRLH